MSHRAILDHIYHFSHLTPFLSTYLLEFSGVLSPDSRRDCTSFHGKRG
jgi:hypothetical protein